VGQATEPTTFGRAESPANYVLLPKNLLDALIATREASYVRGEFCKNPGLSMNQFFDALEEHLNGSEEADYVVKGNFPLTGADCDWFWVVRSGLKRPAVLLFENASWLELLESRSRGYKDIRDVWRSPNERVTRVYRYDGERYRLVHRYDKARWTE
jgi:hypothetical protein